MLRKKLRLSQLDENTVQDKSIPNNIRQDASGEANNSDTTQSIYFRKVAPNENDIPEKFLQHESDLNQHLMNLTFNEPIKYVYNPFVYAYNPHANFVRKYCQTEKKILFVGMNPGPHGMCQTGIPFGEVKLVTEWYKIEGEVLKPAIESPKNKILGFQCHISEPSGKRFGNFFREICETPENFFKHCFIHNMCPLAFLGESKNITPKDIKGPVKKELEKHCNETLLKIIQLLNVEIVIALGRYVEKQLEAILSKGGDVKVIYMNHPSPQCPGNWQQKAHKVLIDNDLLQYFQSGDTEKFYMDIAFKYARDALSNQEVPVGCIFVYDGQIIAQGRNDVNETRNATRHAEINCIDQVIDYSKRNNLGFDLVFRNLTVYVTVEPCIMCAAALYDLCVKRIVYGCQNDRFGGQSVFDVGSVLKPVTSVSGGYRAQAAMDLLKEFYKGVNPNAPTCKAKRKGDKTTM